MSMDKKIPPGWFVAIAVLSIICALWKADPAGSSPAGRNDIYVIPISGTVDPGMSAFVKRALADIPNDPPAIVVLEMDTFGGRVDSALEIVQTLLDAAPKKTVAYVSTKAISAGALISLACNQLFMKHHTTIGDCAPMTYTDKGPEMMGEKFQSPLRAKFRTLARRSGYPEKLAEAMVTADMAVFAVTMDGVTRYMDDGEYDDLSQEEKDRVEAKRTVVAKDELLTMDDAEAHELGFSVKSIDGIEDIPVILGVGGGRIVRIEELWSETFVRLIGRIAPILMMIGLAALYTEIKAPGFGVPGIVGILCLTLVFFNQYLVGLADYTELIFLVIGMILLGFELFVIPGFGIAGIVGLLSICAGMILALQDFTLPDPSLPWQKELLIRNAGQVMAAFVGALIVSLAVLRYVMPGVSRIIKGPYLDATLEDARSETWQTASVQVGDRGEALTFLHPAGKVGIGEETFDMVTEGEFVEKGDAVVVTAIKGNRILVRSKKESGKTS